MTIALGYSKDDELAADAASFRWLLRSGRSRGEALSLPRHFTVYCEKKGYDRQHPPTETLVARAAEEISNHFRSHPPMKERLARLEQLGEK